MKTQSKKDNDSLPVFYRTASIPPDLWEMIKIRGQETETNVNDVIHAAIDAEFTGLIEKLKELGFNEITSRGKLVRIPFDENILGWINYGRRETGLPSILLLKLCLHQFVRNRKDVEQKGRANE